NEINKTLKQDDLFDWLFRIETLRDEGSTQAEIGKRIGWSREAIKNYTAILDKIGTTILNFARAHQIGRVPEDGTFVPFNFTEGLLRSILPLTTGQQMSMVQRLIKGKDKKGHKYNKSDFKKEAAQLKKYNTLVDNGIADVESRIFGDILEKATKAIIDKFIKPEYLNESKKGELGKKALQLIQAFVDEYEKTQNIKIFTQDIANITEKEVENESVDVIITDPPYPKEYIETFNDLGMLAERVLKPGGSLVCLVGQSYIPAYIEHLSKHLDYYWVIGVFMPGGQSVQIWNKKVNAFWKPALWFTKGKRSESSAWISDAFQTKTNNNDKKHHHWGQSEQLMSELVERVTIVGDTVFDPFLGGGTTGVVCNNLNRKFIGSDISQEIVTKALKRIHGK
ncbi:MAG: DNA methyltransferase, partial [Candidatus Auribacterota bacterium]|nr:DNA methyltransferase [Candidatus Auribacterota bacterium]